MTSTRTDVLIIGGGPAGSTFATLMRERGWDVTLVEKDHHPRFHIGESLLPMNLPILERLGVLDEIRRIGVPKLGADFTIADSGNVERTYYFRDALGNSPTHAFEVRRSEFDQVLFERSKRAGIRAFEGMRVTDVDEPANGFQRIRAVDDAGNERHWDARFVADASGRDTFLASRNGWKTRNRRHATAAIFGHFRAVQRRPGEDDGNISLYWFEHGWVWMIPLQDDIVSIGAVCRPEYLRMRRGSIDDYLLATLHGIPEVRERIRNAEPAMPVQATGNYSYSADRTSAPGRLLLGDAYAFIDPVFSSGVFLAMNSAQSGVAVAEAWLSGRRVRYELACRRYRRRIRRGVSMFSWFIYRFTTPAMSNLMSNPRNSMRVVEAVISMLAGDVFVNRNVRWRLRIFKAIYVAVWLRNWRESLGNLRLKHESVRTAAQRGE